MINKDTEVVIRNLCKGGAINAIIEVAKDLQGNMVAPSYGGGTGDTIYKLGEHKGILRGIDMLIEEITALGRPNE
jgi:hypothetical protein